MEFNIEAQARREVLNNLNQTVEQTGFDSLMLCE